jgi:precorrin-2 dehydrogenase/sirohydrochlorin ferrochelatase
MKRHYPAFLDLEGRKCVVVGGGEVALRKVQSLLEVGGEVEVISPELCEGLRQLQLEHSIEVIARRYDRGDLDGAFLVIAATNDRAANEMIADEAGHRGTLINVVDVPDLCNFIVPSSVRRGDLTLAISTSGTGPALARRLRIKMEQEYGPEYESLSRIVREVRAELKERGIRINGASWESALDLDVIVRLIKEGKETEAKVVLVEALNESRKVGRDAR